MRPTRTVTLTAGLGLCLPGIPLLWLIRQPPQRAHRSPISARVSRRGPASPAVAALQEAKRCWSQAQIAIKPEMEALAAADSEAAGVEEGRRKRLMARDRGGCLRRAREAAVRSAAVATSREETYEATLWLALIECDRGHHAAELQQARRLLAMQPGSPTSLGALRRAAKCNGLWRLARQADAALEDVAGDAPSVERNHQTPQREYHIEGGSGG